MSSNVRDKDGNVPASVNKKGTRGGVEYDINVKLFPTVSAAVQGKGEADTLDMINAMLVTRAENEQAPTKEGSGSREVGKAAKALLEGDDALTKEELMEAMKLAAAKKKAAKK